MTAVSPPMAPADTGAVRERVRHAAARGMPLRIMGAGTWMDAGRPVRATELLPLTALTGVVDYVPGDLTLTARAGTSLDEIARVTAAERQWLPLDPPGAGVGTIGATVATASAGPLAHAFGTPRDQLLGLEAVTGEGVLVRAGGRVVKNVAGFDLVRLFTGAWGTLAIITEVTVRLRALPEVDETFALAVAGGADAIAARVGALRAAPALPIAAELVNATLARALGAGDDSALLVRLAGNATAVRAQRDALARVGPLAPLGAGVWTALRAAEPAGAAVVRLSSPPAEFAALWAGAAGAAAAVPAARLHATPARGIVRCIVPAPDVVALARFLVESARGARRQVGERLPAAAWAQLDAGAPAAQLDQRVRAAFDPLGILNPGILRHSA